MIISPYTYNDNEKNTVSEVNNNWDSKREKIKTIKKNIRNYLEGITGRECYYCKIKVDDGISVIQLDHILFKNFYSNFTFKPENLILCCLRCNNLKGEKEVLVDSLRNINYMYDDYPLNSSDYKIIHPYIDNYNEHIHYPEGIFVEPFQGSEKGMETINIYSLYRIALTESRINKHKINFGSKFISHYLGEISDGTSVEELINKHQRMIRLEELITSSEIKEKIERSIAFNSFYPIIDKLYSLSSNLFDLKSKLEELIILLKSIERKKITNTKIINFFESNYNVERSLGFLNNEFRRNLINEIEIDALKVSANIKRDILNIIYQFEVSDEESNLIIELIINSKELFNLFDLIYKMKLFEDNIFEISDSERLIIKDSISLLLEYDIEGAYLQAQVFEGLIIISDYIKFVEDKTFLSQDNLKLLKSTLKYIGNL